MSEIDWKKEHELSAKYKEKVVLAALLAKAPSHGVKPSAVSDLERRARAEWDLDEAGNPVHKNELHEFARIEFV